MHSYHPSLEWTQILTENFAAAMPVQAHIRIDTEYLDAKRRPELEHAQTFLKLLLEKYASRPPDVLVIADDPAFDLLWPLRTQLLPDVPIVFMGLNSVREELTSNAQGVTGIFERHTTEQTVDLALKLTGAAGIIVLNDTSETGKANEAKIGEIVRTHPNVRWVVERDLSIDQIERIAALPSDWPIIPMLPLRESEARGPMWSQRRSVELLRQTLPNPLFYDSEWMMMMGSGLVGGYTLSGADHARQAGELVLQILAGEAPETLAVRYTAKHQWIFDQRELNRFGWSHTQLPANAVYQFTEEGFWQRHREAIYPMLTALIAAALVIVMLSITISRQRKSKSQLRANEFRLSAALAANDAGVFEIRPDQNFASDRWLELTASEVNDTPKVLNVDWMRNATEESRIAYEEALWRLNNSSPKERIEITINDKRPRVLDVLMTSAQQADQNTAIVGVATDVTLTRQLEKEAVRRNRFELLGELAGGIAHDFNNYLLVVKLSADMAKKLDDPVDMRKLIVEIEEAGLRATDIVKQLLAFGRTDTEPGKTIDANASVKEMQAFLQRLLGTQSEMVVTVEDHPLDIPVDRPQLERILSNLVVNARDAMPNGGVVQVEVSRETTNSVNYAVVRVRDEGIGMDESTSEKIFEPFFSTKDVDEGTGLGLSTVYGIVKGSGGTVTVNSKVGVGTTFEIRWPREPVEPALTPGIKGESREPRKTTILLVEDDPRVGPLTQKLLEKSGSRTILASDGAEGLSIYTECPNNFDLILSDVALPKMNGIDMIASVRRLRPSARVAFMSGYTNHPSLNGTSLPPNVALLRKPFSKDELESFVKDQLDEREHSNNENEMGL